MAVKKKERVLKSAKISESYISMALGLLVVIVLGMMIFNFIKGRRQELSLPGIQTPTENEVVPNQAEQVVPTIHVVSPNESLWKIAQKYYNSGYNWVTIAQANNLANPDMLMVGQELTIPEAETITPPKTEIVGSYGSAITANTYRVEKNDSLWKIAVRAYGDGYQWTRIAEANNLANPDIIHVGNELVIPR